MIQRAANLDTLINNVVLGYYVKYDRLKYLIDAQFAGSNATEVDIYIDIKDILYRLDRHLTNTHLPVKNPLILTSSIINMVAHYRNFFATRYNCTSRFFLIDSIGELLACKYCSEFSVPQLSNYMIGVYNTNLEFLPLICQYIYNVQFVAVSTNVVTKALSIYDIERKNNPSIIISKDPYIIQASAHENFYVLVPTKKKGEDISILSNSYRACTDYVYMISKGKSGVNMTKLVVIPVNLLPMLMAMTRVPTRSLKNIINIPTAMQRLEDIYVKPQLQYYPSDIPNFLKHLLDNSPHFNKAAMIEYRYKACDATNTLYNGYKMHPEYITYNGIVNLYDPDSIKVINNEHFKDCPLDLNVL